MQISQEAMKVLTDIKMPEETKPAEEVKPAIEESKTEPVQKTEEVKDSPKEAVKEEPVVEKTTDKKQKIGELVDLKRKARAISRELDSEDKEEVKEEIKEEPAKPAFDQEEFKKQILEEAEAKFKPQLDEVENLRNENEKFQSEKAEVKLKSIINKDVDSFLKEYPQAELMIDRDYLVDLIKSNPKNGDYTVDELILKAYPNATKSPKMDGYSATSKNGPKPLDFSKLEDVQEVKTDKQKDDYLQFLRANKR